MKHHHSSHLPGFTLVELLIVIGIIAVLAGVLMGNYAGIIARVRSTKCETNLKNLANAVSVYTTCGRYPYAESAQYIKTTGGTDNQGVEIREFKGWVSWLSQSTKFPIKGDSPASLSHCSYANQDDKAVTYAITNGAIWTATGANRDCYLCPVHVEKCHKAGVRKPGWSYKMNAYFGYEPTAGRADLTQYSYVESGSLTRADRILLFAEIPAVNSSTKEAKKSGATLPEPNFKGGDNDAEMCGCLFTKGTVTGSKSGQANGSAASIGFNHVRGSEMVGHVVFADGHVETLTAPKDGRYEDLTDWLCQGLDIVTKDKSYQKMDDSVTE